VESPHAAGPQRVHLYAEAFWLPTLGGAVRLGNARSHPWLALSIIEGEHDTHAAVLTEGPAEVLAGLAFLQMGGRYHPSPERGQEARNAREDFRHRIRRLSAEERAVMKGRAAELRAGGRKGARQADGLQNGAPRPRKRSPNW
jgi:hypothetical protein